MEIKVIEHDDAGELLLSGRLDTMTAPEADAAFEQAAEQFTTVTLDLAALEYISSVGLRSLKRLHMALKKKGGSLYLKNTPQLVMEVFEITGFVDLLNII